MVTLFVIASITIVIYMTVWFFVGQVLRRNDVADIAWGLGFVVVAVTALSLQAEIAARSFITTVLIGIWGVRLSSHIYKRNRGKPEDPRYQRWRKEWGRHAVIRAFLQIFLLQGMLLLIISIPVVVLISSGKVPLGWLDAFGILIWLTGFLFEAIGDSQLSQFKKNPENRGRIMDQGLWQYTRHPNYFGEVLLWWGIYAMVLSVPLGWATIAGPLLITVLILKVSGITLLEERYEGNTAYQEYKRRTSAFFPFPPRKETQ
jgi:steroid 5-alpha reductase family enzyme